MMNKMLWAGMALAALLCGGALIAQEAQGPKIETRESRYDFGNVVQGSQANHVFEVHNAGNAPLDIERVVPS